MRDNVGSLIVPPMCATAGFNASQSFAHASSAAVQFNGADAFDTDNMHDTVTNNTRMTVTTPGLYMCTFYAQINTTGVTQFLLGLSINGGAFAESGTGSPVTASAARSSVSGLINATSTSYIEAVVYQESLGSAARNLSSARFTVCWVGRPS